MDLTASARGHMRLYPSCRGGGVAYHLAVSVRSQHASGMRWREGVGLFGYHVFIQGHSRHAGYYRASSCEGLL